MKYNLNVSQIGADNLNLRDSKITVEHLAIFDMLIHFSNWNGCRKKIGDDNHIYYYFAWNLIPDRVPYATAKKRTACRSRYKDLEEAKLLVAHEDNQRISESWYRFGDGYEMFQSKPDTPSANANTDDNSVRDDERQRPQSRTVASATANGSVRDGDHNDSTYMSSTIDNTNLKDDAPRRQKSESSKGSKKTKEKSSAKKEKVEPWSKRWLTAFDEKFRTFPSETGAPYVFQAADAANAKKIRTNLIKLYKSKHDGQDPDEDTLFEAWVWFINRAAEVDQWLVDNWKIGNLYSNYNKVMRGKSTKKTNGRVSSGTEFESYFKRKYS